MVLASIATPETILLDYSRIGARALREDHCTIYNTQLHQNVWITGASSKGYKMSSPLIPAQRRDQIRSHLVISKIARLDELCAMLEASEATVRRDLAALEEAGFLSRTHGGAVLATANPADSGYLQRLNQMAAEKWNVGAAAAALIQPGDVVFVSSGTSTASVLMQIRSDPTIQVFSNNLDAALAAGDRGYDFNLIGGDVMQGTRAIVGEFAMQSIRQVRADKCILAVAGIDLSAGLAAPWQQEAEIERLMVGQTMGDVIVVADHTKYGVTAQFEFCPLDRVSTIVIDSGLPARAQSALRARGIRVVIAHAARGKA